MREDFNKPNNFPSNAITLWKHKDCKHNYASFNIPISDSQALINKGGSQASRKAIIALNESKIRRLRTRGRCGSTYTLKHINFQQHNVATQATINTHQTPIQNKNNTTVGHKLPERRLSLSTNQRFGGYAHVGDAVPHTHSNTSIFSGITLQIKQP